MPNIEQMLIMKDVLDIDTFSFQCRRCSPLLKERSVEYVCIVVKICTSILLKSDYGQSLQINSRHREEDPQNIYCNTTAIQQ